MSRIDPRPIGSPASSFAPSARWLAFGGTLAFVSLGTTQKFIGTGAAILLGLGLTCAVWRLGPAALGWVHRSVSEARARRFGVCLFVAMALVTWQLHAVAQSGRFGQGADSDDALVVGVYELARGHYPYYAKTYLGNPISPLPGAMLLAAPFVALRAVALQNVFWLFVFYLALARATSYVGAVVAVLSVLALCPGVVHQLATGVDYGANAHYVILSAWALLFVAGRGGGVRMASLLALAALHGFTLSSRANFVLLLPLLFSQLRQRVGCGFAAVLIGGTLAAFAGLTLPFYFYDPEAFSPLHAANKITIYADLLPGVGILLPGAAGMLAVFLARPSRNDDLASFFRNCALVQAVPVVGVVALESVRQGAPAFILSGFGIFSLYFVVAWCWKRQWPGEPIGSARSASRATTAATGPLPSRDSPAPDAPS